MASKMREKIQGNILNAVLDNLNDRQTVTIGLFPTVRVTFAGHEEGRRTTRWDFVRDPSNFDPAQGRHTLCGPKFHAESAWSLSDAIRIALNLLND
jgi:hypothetical protein